MESKRLHRPTENECKKISEKYGLSLTDKELTSYTKIIEASLAGFDLINQLPEYLPEVKYPRLPGKFPTKEENPYNAWYVKTDIKGASSGKLSGKKIVLKDNICLAGVPFMNGSHHLEGYIPEIDATLVTRILDAGGTIVGKAHCEDLCLSGGSHTNNKNAVINPHKAGHTSGGSSSGVGALVGAGEVEMGIGGDQGGSIRIPSGWCGCYGMKPTHGLVPYTGIMPIEPTLDHAGPITTNVSDNALLLEVIAGPDDELDQRQYIHESAYDYTSHLKEGVKGLKIGVLKEGFGTKGSEEIVDKLVKKAVQEFEKLGATVEEVSIPDHSLGGAIFGAICNEGSVATMLSGNGYGTGYRGLYLPSMMKAQSRWKAHPNEMSESLKVTLILSDYLKEEYEGTMYAKGQNLSRKLKKAYNDALKKYDIIVMPTLPFRAPELPKDDCSLETYISQAFGMLANTCQFDLTGHPAMTIPIAVVDDLPIGMMLVSKHFGESVIYRAAYAWEQAYDWKKYN